LPYQISLAGNNPFSRQIGIKQIVCEPKPKMVKYETPVE